MKWFTRNVNLIYAVSFLFGSIVLGVRGGLWASGLCAGGVLVCIVMWAVQQMDNAQDDLNRSGVHYFAGKYYALVEKGDHELLVETLKQNNEFLEEVADKTSRLHERLNAVRPGVVVQGLKQRIH